MQQSVYKKVDYTLQGLIEKIKLGEIALPDLQRPFIWKNSAVRDLFDSLYLGYPVGFFLFWETAGIVPAKAIGTAEKQKEPKLLVVDGQQRLTSLYAIITGAQVLRDNFRKEHIEIAFDPINSKFEVGNATTQKNKSFIPNISILWSTETDIFDICDDYLARLRGNRSVSDEESRRIKKRIQRVSNIINTQFIALELSSEIDVEGVAEVFVRINSKGKPLQQADFILTLMSVFWEPGRKDLESFCYECRMPSTGKASAYNHFVSPDPDVLLRAGIGLGFRRARLNYVYSLLTGRDLETGQKDETRRDAQFKILQAAQKDALNLQNWHDYLKCINDAGFRSSRMLSGERNVIYSYVIYLIGRIDYKIPKERLASIISQWFFMAALTSRYSSSPESKMESDLALFRDAKTADEFVGSLSRICAEKMTEDFWNITVPSVLANSSATNTAMMAFFASQVLLGAPALYSKRKVADLLDPSIHSPRSALERHHLFPKAFLERHRYSQTERNQTANYAIIEYVENADILDADPKEYVPIYEAKFEKSALTNMYRLHALPDGWHNMDYKEFLLKRRELMARVIHQGYESLIGTSSTPAEPSKISPEAIKNLEGDYQEFKSTLRKNLHTGQNDAKMELGVLKTIAGFLNARGGTLYIGLDDDGVPLGLHEDGFPNEDKMLLHLTNLINARLGQVHNLYITYGIEDYLDNRVLVVRCETAQSAVWLKDNNDQRYFVRMGPSTGELKGAAAQDYIEKRF